MIGIVNYQRGNLNNVYRAFEKFGFEAEIIDESDNLEKFKGIVLPGVGAFADAMENLKEKNFDKAIVNYIQTGKPFLGICLGLQLLFEKSLEFESCEGLGVFKGNVVPFEIDEKVPHIGWNQVNFKKPSNIIKDIPENEYFYFVHSYYVEPKEEDIILTTTRYGVDFVSSIEKDNIFACQFHPEKSQGAGLEIIKDFGEFCDRYSGN